MKPDTLFNQAVHLLCETTADSALPYSEQLYQIAGAAVGFALQLADCSQTEMDELLRGSQQTGPGLEAAVQSFANTPTQEELRSAARSTGIPLLALAAGQILHHFLAADTAGAQEHLRLLEMATAYCLRFTLTLARLYPDVAMGYRELIPTPDARPTRRSPRKRRPKTP